MPSIQELNFNSFNRKDSVDLSQEIDLAQTNQIFPNSSIDFSKLTINSLNINESIQSSNYILSTTGWQIRGDGTAQFVGLTLTGGTINYGKTSFIDSTNAGYYISSDGVYFGAAADATKLKFTIATGALDYIGTISSRSTATIASAINASGNFVDANLNTATKTILDAFTFGASGAIQIGTYVNGVSGDLRISPNGILGRDSAGATTIAVDGTTGNVTLSGTITATAGTFGQWTIAGNTFSTGLLNNIFIGLNAGNNITTGSGNIVLGQSGGASLTEGTQNIFIGPTVGQSIVKGNYNVYLGNGVGSAAGANSDLHIGNTSVGYQSATSLTSGQYNTFLGYQAGYGVTTGVQNIMIGPSAGGGSVDAANNTFIGVNSGYACVSGGQNVFVGYNAGRYETGSNKLFIDNAARASEADARTKALIYGIFDAAVANQYLYVNGNLVLGIDLPVSEGGTGVSTNTAYAVLCGGTTTTGAIQSVASVGSSGQVLTSNGAGALPTFQTISSDTVSSQTLTAKQAIVADNAVLIGDGTDTSNLNINGGSAIAVDLGKSDYQKWRQVITAAEINNNGSSLIKVDILKVNSPTDDILVKIWDSTFTSVLASATIPNASITTSFQTFSLVLSTYIADVGIIVEISRSSAIDGTNYYQTRCRNTKTVAASAERYRDDTTWQAPSSADLQLELKLTLDAGYMYLATGAIDAAVADLFTGFAESSISVGGTGTIKILGYHTRSAANITAGAWYYLSDTAGAIATSAGSFSKRIGRAHTTTKLFILQADI